MRFILLTLIVSILIYLFWPWIKTFFTYLSKKYADLQPIKNKGDTIKTPNQQEQTTTKETNNEPD